MPSRRPTYLLGNEAVKSNRLSFGNDVSFREMNKARTFAVGKVRDKPRESSKYPRLFREATTADEKAVRKRVLNGISIKSTAASSRGEL